MTLATLVATLAERSGTSKREARAVLDALAEIVQETLSEQDTVKLPGLGTFRASWRPERTIRSVRDARKVRVAGSWVARFKASSHLKRALAGQHREPAARAGESEALRVASTLVSDLKLYGGAPDGLRGDMELGEVRARCAAHYGEMWSDAVQSFVQRIPASVRGDQDFLGLAARERLSAA